MTEREWLEIFANNLKEIIKESNLTQKEFSKKTGLSESAISSYINKQKLPSIRAILAINYTLGIDLYELIDFGDRIV